jgi:hypothetical protein
LNAIAVLDVVRRVYGFSDIFFGNQPIICVVDSQRRYSKNGGFAQLTVAGRGEGGVDE